MYWLNSAVTLGNHTVTGILMVLLSNKYIKFSLWLQVYLRFDLEHVIVSGLESPLRELIGSVERIRKLQIDNVSFYTRIVSFLNGVEVICLNGLEIKMNSGRNEDMELFILFYFYLF